MFGTQRIKVNNKVLATFESILMMARSQTSHKKTQGERNAISGYLPQYEEFARCVYDSIIKRNFVEMRVADYDENVGKLDDICYVTNIEVHAYQVKWSNVREVLTLGGFKLLLQEIVESWKKLHVLYPNKKVIPHLLTNRSLGARFDINKETTIQQLKTLSKLSDDEWDLFWTMFDFTHDYVPEDFNVSRRLSERRVEDVRNLVSFIVNKVADKKGVVVVSRQEIINTLNWNSRFESLYNHDLTIPETSYEPNANAIIQLNNLLKNKTKGYIFLKGTPGSGKSTLLTQWVRSIPNYSVRYYAFDFTNPSSQRYNDSQRGEGISFLYDIVQELETAGFGNSNTLVYKEYDFLKKRFYELLEGISEEFRKTNLPVVIVVDGLDHITREYDVQSTNIMGVLPSVTDLPDGVVFVLGSQHFEHLGLNANVKIEYKKENSIVEMPPFSKTEVERLVVKMLGQDVADDDLVAKCMEKSQGHPLYLRYIFNQIAENGVGIIDSLEEYADDIETYYSRIVGSSLENVRMKHYLGLLSRVTGSVNTQLIGDWDVDEQILADFKKEMWHMFKHDNDSFSFFHNSFRQYLLRETAIDILSGKYSKKKNLEYYSELANYFESQWDEGYYLFQAEKHDAFIERLTPDVLFKQAQDFRPLWSIKKDLKYALSIAKQKRDPYLLIRYMLFDVQLSQMDNLDYSSLTLIKEFIQLGKGDLAKAIIREDNKLHCNTSYALELAKLFLKSGDKVEASKLFDLAYPEYVGKRGSNRGLNRMEFDGESSKLKLWVNVATFFMSSSKIEENIEVFIEYLRKAANIDSEHFNSNKICEEFGLEYAKSLIEQERWDELNNWLDSLGGKKPTLLLQFVALREAALKTNDTANNGRATIYRNRLLHTFTQLPESDKPYLPMAYLGWKLGMDRQIIVDCLNNVAWSDLESYYLSEVRASFKKLRPRIAYVKLHAAYGYDDKTTVLVPTNTSDTDNSLMEQYARKVFYLAKLNGMALCGQNVNAELNSLIDNYISFFDRLSFTSRNKYEYTILCQRADFYEYLIEVASQCGMDVLVSMGKKMESYFTQSYCHADADAKRRAVLALFQNGIEKQTCIRMLEGIEYSMMESQDLDGRTGEAYAQGKAWLTLGENDRAKAKFHEMVLESFGVGYRKDYQPSMFAEWIGIANKYSCEETIDRIHWMTSRLRYIREVAENRTVVRAGEKLLECALDFDFGSGIKLARWLLDEEFGYFQSISKIILDFLLRQINTQKEYDALLSYYTQIHLYFDDSGYDADTHLLERVVKKGMTLLNTDFEKVKPIFQRSIKVQCPENSVDVFMETLEKVYDHTDDNERESTDVVATNSSNGETWETAMEAVRKSSPWGWARYNDGGTRIDACKKLQRVDKEKGRAVTFDLFADDIKAGHNNGTMLYLDEIVPMLTETVDSERLFQEEFDYMNRILRNNTSNSNDKPDITPTEGSVYDALEDWLIYLANMPVVCLSERAMILLTFLVDGGRTSIVEKIKGSTKAERELLELGMYLKEIESSQLPVLKEQALMSAISENYLNRIYAKSILESLGEFAPKPSYRPLVSTYQMSFTESPKYNWGNAAPKSEGVPDWNDASSIMAVASHLSNYLAYASGFNKKAIDARAVTLMRKYGPITEENTEYDKRIGKHYDEIGLRNPYRRAHAMSALDGMYEVAAELIDGKAINGILDDDWFLSYDFSVIKLSIDTKPDFIQRIAKKDEWGVSDGWDANLSDSPRLNEEMNQYKGMTVIGEYTHLLKCSDKVPVEEYLSKISYDNEKMNANGFFGDAFQIQSSNYLRIGNDDPQIIIRRGGYFSISSIKLCWIAINPAFAYAMGWKPSSSGTFSWDDIDGNRMVESVYWQSGNVNGRNRSNYEASEGWLVIASDKALEAIKSVADVYLHKLLQRGFHALTYEFPRSIQKIFSL